MVTGARGGHMAQRSTEREAAGFLRGRGGAVLLSCLGCLQMMAGAPVGDMQAGLAGAHQLLASVDGVQD